MTTQRIRIVAAASASAVLLAVDAVVYAIALGSLGSSGPTAFGYGWLALANHTAALVAILVAITAALLAVGGRARLVSAVLLASAVTTLGGCIGLRVLGRSLAAIQPEQQPAGLNSLLLALIGTGSDLMAVPIVLAAAAAVTLLIAITRRRSHALARV